MRLGHLGTLVKESLSFFRVQFGFDALENDRISGGCMSIDLILSVSLE